MSKKISRRRKKEVQRLQLYSPKRYGQALKKAEYFVNYALSGDNAFAEPDVQLTAVQSAVVGWMSEQRWFLDFAKRLHAEHKRDCCWDHAWDFALQVACDAVS